MMYAYTGKYREFRGYQFIDGRPVTITDRATLAAIAREPDFRKVEDEKAPQAQAPVLTPRRSILSVRRR